MVKWEVSIYLYIFALTFMPLLRLIASLIHKGLSDSWPIFNPPDWAAVIFSVLFMFWSQAGEELGWRGFALPRMAKNIGLPLATVLLGALWALWHLPLFYVSNADTFGQSFPVYFIQVTGISVAIGWLFWRSKGSLLLPMLMHTVINNTKGIVQAALPEPGSPFSFHASLLSWTLAGLIWLCGGYFLWEMKGVKEVE